MLTHFIIQNPECLYHQTEGFLACGFHIGDFVASHTLEKITCKNCRRTKAFKEAHLAVIASHTKALKKPLNHYIKQNVSVEIAEIINRDHENFLDMLSELTVNDTLLMDISWKLISTDPMNDDCIILEVTGDPTESDRD